MESDLSSIEENESDLELNFDCIKCGYEYDTFAESEYYQCNNCFIMSCKNCRFICEECNSNCCTRCSFYIECCKMVLCNNCYSYCEYCTEEHCNKCVKFYECMECNQSVCENNISKDHKNIYCIDCCIDFCTLCNLNIFVYNSDEDDEVERDLDYYTNPCKICLREIHENLLKTEIKIPDELINNIINYIKI